MSVESSHYLIYGYNLTGMDTDKFEKWKWSDEGDKYSCNQIPGRTQIFDDPMSGCHLYLGYIFAEGRQFEGCSARISDDDLVTGKAEAISHLNHLIDYGIISEEARFIKPELILFEECY